MSRDLDFERKHPRHPAGSSRGGEFRDKLDASGYAHALLETARQIADNLEEDGQWDVSLADKIGKLNIAMAYGGTRMEEAGQGLLDYLLSGPPHAMGSGGYLTQDDLPGPPPWERHTKGESHFVEWQGRRIYENPPADWATKVGARLPNPFPNNERGIAALRAKVTGNDPVVATNLAGGQTAQTNRWDFADGTSIVRKAFFGGLDDVFDEDEFDYDPFDEESESREGEGEGGIWYDEEQEAEAVAEVKASSVAEVIGAPALTVIRDPAGEPNVVYYGYADGHPPSPEEAQKALQTDEAVLIGVLDLLIANSDRNADTNWLVGPDGKPIAIDHGEAFQGLDFSYFDGNNNRVAMPITLYPGSGPFAGLLVTSRYRAIDLKTGKEVVAPPSGTARYEIEETWHDSRLHPDDIALMKQRIQRLYENERLNYDDNRYMQAMLDKLGEHARGTRRLVR